MEQPRGPLLLCPVLFEHLYPVWRHAARGRRVGMLEEHLAPFRLAQRGQGTGRGPAAYPATTPWLWPGLARVEGDLDVVVGGHRRTRDPVAAPEGLVIEGHHLDFGPRRVSDGSATRPREDGVEPDARRQ